MIGAHSDDGYVGDLDALADHLEATADELPDRWIASLRAASDLLSAQLSADLAALHSTVEGPVKSPAVLRAEADLWERYGYPALAAGLRTVADGAPT